MEEHIQSYFFDIFTSRNPDVATVIDLVKPVVPEAHVQNLLAPFCGEEVRTSLFSMLSNKALGPDGFNPGFFQFYWDIVGPDVISFSLYVEYRCLIN